VNCRYIRFFCVSGIVAAQLSGHFKLSKRTYNKNDNARVTGKCVACKSAGFDKVCDDPMKWYSLYVPKNMHGAERDIGHIAYG
jgi:hypothetical protein